LGNIWIVASGSAGNNQRFFVWNIFVRRLTLHWLFVSMQRNNLFVLFVAATEAPRENHCLSWVLRFALVHTRNDRRVGVVSAHLIARLHLCLGGLGVKPIMHIGPVASFSSLSKKMTA
jgi:hypothetical protein